MYMMDGSTIWYAHFGEWFGKIKEDPEISFNVNTLKKLWTRVQEDIYKTCKSPKCLWRKRSNNSGAYSYMGLFFKHWMNNLALLVMIRINFKNRVRKLVVGWYDIPRAGWGKMSQKKYNTIHIKLLKYIKILLFF